MMLASKARFDLIAWLAAALLAVSPLPAGTHKPVPHGRHWIAITGKSPGATPEFFRSNGLRYPPSEGPLAAVTPGNPGGLMVMLAEFDMTAQEACEAANVTSYQMRSSFDQHAV